MVSALFTPENQIQRLVYVTGGRKYKRVDVSSQLDMNAIEHRFTNNVPHK